jgi:hypothetical protein
LIARAQAMQKSITKNSVLTLSGLPPSDRPDSSRFVDLDVAMDALVEAYVREDKRMHDIMLGQ